MSTNWGVLTIGQSEKRAEPTRKSAQKVRESVAPDPLGKPLQALILRVATQGTAEHCTRFRPICQTQVCNCGVVQSHAEIGLQADCLQAVVQSGFMATRLEKAHP